MLGRAARRDRRPRRSSCRPSSATTEPTSGSGPTASSTPTPSSSTAPRSDRRSLPDRPRRPGAGRRPSAGAGAAPGRRRAGAAGHDRRRTCWIGAGAILCPGVSDRRSLGGRGRQRRHPGRPLAGRRRRQSVPRDPPALGSPRPAGSGYGRPTPPVSMTGSAARASYWAFIRRGWMPRRPPSPLPPPARSRHRRRRCPCRPCRPSCRRRRLRRRRRRRHRIPGSAACRRSSPDAPAGCRSGSRRDGGGCRGRGRRRRCSRPSGTGAIGASCCGSARLASLRDLLPGTALGGVRDDVEGEPDRMLAVGRVDGILGEAVGDEDVVPGA